MLIHAENTSAVVIDVQEKLMPVMSGKEILEKNICTLIRGLKTLGVPMVVTQQYTKGIGMTIPSVREALEDDAYFDKKSFSCYGDPAIKEAIDSLGRKEDVSGTDGERLHAHIGDRLCILPEDGGYGNRHPKSDPGRRTGDDL